MRWFDFFSSEWCRAFSRSFWSIFSNVDSFISVALRPPAFYHKAVFDSEKKKERKKERRRAPQLLICIHCNGQSVILQTFSPLPHTTPSLSSAKSRYNDLSARVHESIRHRRLIIIITALRVVAEDVMDSEVVSLTCNTDSTPPPLRFVPPSARAGLPPFVKRKPGGQGSLRGVTFSSRDRKPRTWLLCLDKHRGGRGTKVMNVIFLARTISLLCTADYFFFFFLIIARSETSFSL